MKKFVKRPVSASTRREVAEDFLNYLVDEKGVTEYDIIVDGFLRYLPENKGVEILERFAKENNIPFGRFE